MRSHKYMVFGPPFFAVPDMKVIGWLSKKGYIAILMTRRRKLLHIWPIDYSGYGSRGLQTFSPEKYSLHLDTGFFSVYSIQAKLLIWIPGQEWARHKVYELALRTIAKLHIAIISKNLIGLKMTFCLFGNIPVLLVLRGTNDALCGNTSLMHPTAHASTQSCKSLGGTTAPIWWAAIAVLTLLCQIREKIDAIFSCML